jgi:tRNA(fMet)-specific endonuclease VapC
MLFILDTNSLIDYFKGRGRVAATSLQTSPRDTGVPSIALYELEVGIAKSTSPTERSEQLVAVFVSVVSVLPIGSQEAKLAARIRADLVNRRHSRG